MMMMVMMYALVASKQHKKIVLIVNQNVLDLVSDPIMYAKPTVFAGTCSRTTHSRPRQRPLPFWVNWVTRVRVGARLLFYYCDHTAATFSLWIHFS